MHSELSQLSTGGRVANANYHHYRQRIRSTAARIGN